MNGLAQVEKAVTKAFPSAKVSLDAAEKPTGTSWLDVRLKKAKVTVEWRPGQGFGVSSGKSGLIGEGSHEVLLDANAAAERVLDLLQSGERSKPLREVLLKEIRGNRHITQEQLARVLHVKQATVSKMENRSDLRLTTLQRLISAMGGKLELHATFPGVKFQIAAPALPSPMRRARAGKAAKGRAGKGTAVSPRRGKMMPVGVASIATIRVPRRRSTTGARAKVGFRKH